jgi:YVTN family beta-propeller protein
MLAGVAAWRRTLGSDTSDHSPARFLVSPPGERSLMRSPIPRLRLASAILIPCSLLALALALPAPPSRAGDDTSSEPHRSPIALALSADGGRALTANQTSGSVSLVDLNKAMVLAEIATGEKPAGVALSPDGKKAAVTHWYGYDVVILDVGPESLKLAGRIDVGHEPRGIVIAADGRTAYAAIGVSNEVIRLDLDKREITGRVAVGREPRGLALSPDGKMLLVGNSRSGSISVVSTADLEVTQTVPIDGANLRQISVDSGGQFAYIANMRNRGFAVSKNNIDAGWVLGQRLTRVPLSGTPSFSTLSLDPQGKAAADAHGVAITRDGRILAVGLGGTHEIMLLRTDGTPLPWRRNNSRDLMPIDLVRDPERFRRVDVGGRPTEIAFAPDDRSLIVANYLHDALQVVDVEKGEVSRTIPLGGRSEPSLARRGEALFHDATRSFNQWYSCNTCHSDGHTSGLDFDTMNDGWNDFSTAHEKSRKKVPTLRRVVHTGPWTWHGWQTSLEESMNESFTKSMQGPPASDDEIAALVAYLETLDYPRNPHRGADGSISEAATRGQAVYRSSKAACANCHGGPELTDGKIHTIGLEERRDVYKGYNPPSLRGLYDKDPYIHDGRTPDLREAITKWHNPEEVTGLGELSETELDDLIEYLKTL